jgi:hypothetical protein
MRVIKFWNHPNFLTRIKEFYTILTFPASQIDKIDLLCRFFE